jgi:hypothetical protein
MVARNWEARKRPRHEKHPRPKTRERDEKRPVAAFGLDIGNDQLECRCEDDACLARQAGPGPRI